MPNLWGIFLSNLCKFNCTCYYVWIINFVDAVEIFFRELIDSFILFNNTRAFSEYSLLLGTLWMLFEIKYQYLKHLRQSILRFILSYLSNYVLINLKFPIRGFLQLVLSGTHLQMEISIIRMAMIICCLLAWILKIIAVKQLFFTFLFI